MKFSKLQHWHCILLTAYLNPFSNHLPAGEIYQDASQPLEVRVSDLLLRLTLEEKLSIVHADSKFTTASIPRLNISRRCLDDGPHGVRKDVGPDTCQPAGRTDDFSTAMPCGICLAAT